MSTRNAKRVKDVTGMQQIMIDLKPKRCDSDVYINQKMDVTKLMEYMKKKKKEDSDLTFFHIIVAAIGKVFYNRNKLNRFVSDRHIFEHNDIVVSFVAKISFDDKSEEMMIMIPIEPNDNINTISKKIKNYVEKIRNSKKIKKEGANDAIDVIGKFPNFIRIPVVALLKWCDKKGILPSSLVKDNLYYSSIILSNLGSIKCGAIYHNLTCFGTCSSLATIGEIKNEDIHNDDGSEEIRKMCEFGINFDERIADGYYFAKSLKLLQYIFDNPELLEEEASQRIDLGENR
jgi:pyruvate/2-oxoglutarate dehydrogenase complex dihydrolipoamide acyltransferase (E2) component